MRNIYLALLKAITNKKAGMLLAFVLLSGSVLAQNITGATSVYEGDVANYEYYDWNMGFDPNFNVIGGTKLTESFGYPYTVQVQWGFAGTGTVQYRSGETVMAELSVSITVPLPVTPNTTFSMFAQCGTTMVSRNQDPSTSIRWYWQTSPTGTSTDLGYAASINRTVSGDLYLRARHESVTSAWSYSSLYVGNVALVTSPPNAGSINGAGTVCVNYPSSYTITNQLAASGQGNISYQWEQSEGSPNNWVPIANTNWHNYSPSHITTITYYRRRAFNECGSAFTNSIALIGNPTVAAAGSDQTGSTTCGLTSVNLAGNTPSIGIGSWSVISGAGGFFGNTSSPNSTFSGIAGATYTLRWTITNSSCSSFDDVIIKFNQNASIANAGVDQIGSAMCGLTSVALAGNVPNVGTGSWSIVVGDGGYFGNASAANSTFYGVAGIAYTLRWTIANSPCNSNFDDVVIAFNRNPTTANAGADQTGSSTCGLTNVTLAGNAPAIGTGSWSILSGAGGFFGNASAANSTFSGVAGATYTLRWTINNSVCASSFDDVVITFNQNPTAANAGVDQTGSTTCGQTNVTLAGNVPAIGTGNWSIISGSGGVFGNASSANSTFSGVAGSTYTLRWTINNSVCTSSFDDVVITFNQIPTTANAGADQTGSLTCGLTNVTLAGNVPAIGTGAWSIISGNGGSFGNVSSANSTFTGVVGTPYTLRWTISNTPCNASTDDVFVTFNQNPTAAFAGLDQTGASTCGLNSITLAGNTPIIGTGSWTIITGNGGVLANASVANTTFTGIAGTTYTLGWTISNGACTSATDQVLISFNALSVGGTVNQSTETYGTATGSLELTGYTGNILNWQQKISSANWTDISNTTTSQSYSTSSTTRYRAVVKNGVCANAYSTEAEVIVNPIPVINIVGPSELAPSSNTQLETQSGLHSYQWYRNSIVIVGANSFDFIVTQPGLYKVAVQANSGSPEYVTEEVNIRKTLDIPLQDMNYVRTTTFSISGVNEATDVYQLNPQDYAIATNYFDGLGRPVQSVVLGAAGNGNDLITPVEYDAYGREAKKYLPYAHANRDGRYQPNALSDQNDFYDDANNKVVDDTAPYALTVFEPSPLNRVIKQGAPGLAWQPNGDHTFNSADHTVKFSYEFNQANEVLQWTFTYPTEEYTTTALNAFGKVEAGTAAAPVFYPANQLYKNKTKDEQGNQVIEYVDKEGRTLLKRVQVATSNPSTTDTNRDLNWASTYYIYDDFGNLVCVIPPEPTKRLASQYYQSNSTETSKNNFLKRWAFRYRYDGRQRMIMKQVPGAEPLYMVYDDRDRLVMTQDGNQRSLAGRPWTFTKYDARNRPIATGLKDTTVYVILTQSQMQTLINEFYTKASSRYYEEYVGNAPGNLHGYSNQSFPTTHSAYGATVGSPNENYFLTLTYYDDYTSINSWGSDYEYNDLNLQSTKNGIDYHQPDIFNNRVRGQVTASKTKVLDGGKVGGYTWLKAVNYYDDKYRLIQSISDNYKGGTDRITNVFDFVGKVLTTSIVHITQDVNWKDLVNTSVVGNKLLSGSTFTNSWGNSGAASAESSQSSQDVWMKFNIVQMSGNTIIGLTDQSLDAGYTTIDYGFYITGGSLRIYENGANKFTVGSGHKSGDELKIIREGTSIKYFKNNEFLYTSLTPSSSTLLADVAFYNNNIAVSNVRTSFTRSEKNTTRRFDYDHAGRLINTWHSFSGQPEILLTHNEYNELGQLIDKKLHSTVSEASNAKQSVDYAYNIRGWLTHINDAALTTQAQEVKDYFGMELAYNTDLGTGNPLDKLQFNGNINAIKWSNNQGLGDQKENAYNFTYDPLNRLKTADFRQKDVASWGLAKYRDEGGIMQNVNAFYEHISSYDLNGNIFQLQRSGQDGSLIDNLSYSYGAGHTSQSNKLLKVTDAANDVEGFKEINTVIDDYSYDKNGNLTIDRNKSSEELLTNGEFNEGSANWTSTESSRLTFANNRIEISAGTIESIITQETPIKRSTNHIVNLNLVRTSSTGSLNIKVGSSPANYTVTSSTSLSMTTNSGTSVTNDVKIIVTPDFAGYIESISVHTATVITYNYLNLPETVARGDDGNIRYIYTATGQKLAQVVTEGIKTKTTDYAGEYIYQNDTLQFVNHEEGRLIPLPPGEVGGEATYQYHLKDHLGNVRITFTTKDETEEKLATLETANESEERANFLKYDDIRKVNSTLFDHTNNGTTQYAMRLSGTPEETYGLARSIAVMPGDVISAEVFAKYVDLSQPDVTTALEDFIGAIVAGATAPGTIIDGGGYGSPGAGTIPYGNLLNKTSEGPGAPKAYLNWIVFDKNFVPLASKSGFDRISTSARENGSLAPEGIAHEQLLTPTIEITEPGYVYIYLSNEEPGTEVYFDDFKVTHTKSPVIQSDSYYPFGLTFNSYQRENSTKNRYLYNQGTGDKKFNTERIFDLGLDVDMTKFRVYDPAIGRWWQVDPKSDQEGQEIWSPYNYAFDNPIRYNDPNGDCIPCIIAAAASTFSALKVKYSNIAKPGQEAGQRLIGNKSGSTPPNTGMSKTEQQIIKMTGVAQDGVQVAKSAKNVATEVVKDGGKGTQEAGDTMQKVGIATSAVGLPQVGGPLVAVGTALSTTGTVLSTAANVMEGNYSGAATQVAGAVIDNKASGVITNVVAKQGMNEQSRAILEANKEVIKEVAVKVAEQVTNNQ